MGDLLVSSVHLASMASVLFFAYRLGVKKRCDVSAKLTGLAYVIAITLTNIAVAYAYWCYAGVWVDEFSINSFHQLTTIVRYGAVLYILVLYGVSVGLTARFTRQRLLKSMLLVFLLSSASQIFIVDYLYLQLDNYCSDEYRNASECAGVD